MYTASGRFRAGLRLPRVLVGTVVGAVPGLAVAVVQTLIRDPPADPGLRGVSAGVSAAVVIAIGALGITSLTGYYRRGPGHAAGDRLRPAAGRRRDGRGRAGGCRCVGRSGVSVSCRRPPGSLVLAVDGTARHGAARHVGPRRRRRGVRAWGRRARVGGRTPPTVE
ncbi:iron chelate uptake ABC transporter family permease subunit [Streptomyces sp. enrichment culture]|uniref:iron chelate uptake ABC transporter family permease subunit n=1 Tax=Streptomyces sp. enrichment culture TaxID=1795815 RepID=UPI003F56DD3C